MILKISLIHKVGIIALLVLFQSAFVFGVPNTFNEQGILRNSTNNELINGSRDFNISIYQSNGTLQYSSSQSYTLVNGVYNLLWNNITPEMFQEEGVNYFTLKIGDTVFDSIDFTSVPYSLVAGKALSVGDGLVANISSLNRSINDLNNSIAALNLTPGIQNNTDAFLNDLNVTGSFGASVDCGLITGGSDADYCSDGGGGADVYVDEAGDTMTGNLVLEDNVKIINTNSSVSMHFSGGSFVVTLN